MTKQPNRDKSKSFKTSDQVKAILHKEGLSKVFNYTDYEYFESRAKKAFNPAFAVAEMFIQEYSTESDLTEYEF